ncbi:hypothetical protein [uncultured Desulfuromonas sp.]|uniref:hypothetical protein n=1 Tax=uncultured Desulfuromonas sp. TaxID=181013 RepID=UPI002AAB1685|nr:hypothetical protein [uncultured Desulfuromonas sp.]
MKFRMIGLLALMATLAAGTAFAANRVEVKVTSEPIAQYATCEKAGGYTMEWDSGSTILGGDQLTIDLPLNVTLCNDIDIMLPWTDAAGGVPGVDAGDDNGVPRNTLAAYAAGTAGAAFSGAPVDEAEDAVYFYISGDAGTQRVTINVVAVGGVTGITVGGNADDVFTLEFFDQNTDGIFVDDDDADAVYNNAGVIADNTRCINVSAYSNETVKDSLDSAADKYTFIPSDPQVAHIVAATGYSLYECDKNSVGRIIMGEAEYQGSESCVSFDFEDGDGYCANTHSANNALIIKATADMPITDYNVELEILTDGVYWSDETVDMASYEDAANACAGTNSVGDDLGLTPTYTDAAGETESAAAPRANGTEDCDVADGSKAVTLYLTGTSPVGADARYLEIDMPAFNYDLDEITAGDEVEVRVKLSKAPCGEIIEDTFVVGTFGCIEAGVSYDVTFPYFTQITGDAFWDGMAIVNLSGTAGTAELTIYEADGDVFTASYDVEAHGMVVFNTSDLLSTATGSGTLGDARFYVEVEADFNVDGFAMMANSATGESMGYLPRK